MALDPCVIDECISPADQRYYGCAKWLILAGLLALLLGAFLPGCRGAAATDVDPEARPQVVQAARPTAVPGPGCYGFPQDYLIGDEVIISGAGLPNSDIRVVANDSIVLGETTTNGSGDWALPATFREAGTYSISARQMDGDRILSRCVPSSLTINTPTVTAPTIGIVGGGTALGALSFAGQCEAGSVVEMLRNGARIGTTRALSDGSWSYLVNVVSAGDYDFSVRCPNWDGTKLTSSVASVSIAAPEPVVEEAEPVVEEAEPVPERIVYTKPVITGITGGGEGEAIDLTGTAEPNTTVIIWANGEQIGTTTSDADGNWSFSATLPPGPYRLYARTTFEDLSTKQSNTESLTVAGEVVVEEEAPEEEAVGLTVDVVGTDGEAANPFAPALVGTAPAGDLQIFTGDALLGSASAGADGAWNFESTCSLPPGEYMVNVQAADGSSEEVTITVANPAPAFVPPVAEPGQVVERVVCEGEPAMGQIVGTTYIVATCEYVNIIASRMGVSVADLIAYNPQLSDPTTIYPGQILNIPAGASCLEPTPPSDG